MTVKVKTKKSVSKNGAFPEPQTELGKKLIERAKRIRESGTPLLSFEEIEQYLGRELGTIPAKLKKGKRG